MSEALPASQAATPPSARSGWWAVAVFLVLTIVSQLDRQMLNLLVVPVRADLGISDFQVSLLQGFAFAVFYATFGLPLGWLIDRYSRRHIIFAGVSLWAIAASACGLARTYGQLLAARMTVGIGEASLAPASYSLLGDLFRKDRLTLPMSVMGAGNKLGISAATLIDGGLLAALPAAGLTFAGFGHFQA